MRLLIVALMWLTAAAAANAGSVKLTCHDVGAVSALRYYEFELTVDAAGDVTEVTKSTWVGTWRPYVFGYPPSLVLLLEYLPPNKHRPAMTVSIHRHTLEFSLIEVDDKGVGTMVIRRGRCWLQSDRRF